MPTNDYIPADDAGLLSFAETLQAFLNDTPADVGLLPADATELGTARGPYELALAASNAAKASNLSTTQTKNLRRAELIPVIRSLVNRIQAFPGTSNTERAALGITIRDTTPTAVAAPVSQPVIFINTSNRLQHTIEFRDSLTPLSKAKPQGVSGCEIFRKVGGTAPVSISECDFVALDSASPYLIEYDVAQGGVMVHYIGRWATRSGLTGPASDVMSATVVA